MSIYKSKQTTVYNAKTGKNTPIYQLNTNKLTVTYTNPETLKINIYKQNEHISNQWDMLFLFQWDLLY